MRIVNIVGRFFEINKENKVFWGLLLIWIACDLLQSVHMEIMPDEAYYALYGQHLAWGYYDHPPMVAVLNYFSACLFSGNLSIRFINILLHAATVWLIWKLVPGKKSIPRVLFFFAIACSFFMFSAYGFITTPDGSLLFFTAAFLFFYQRFLEDESRGNIVCLALAMTGMCYSKYHAVLVIGFIVLSNLRLLRNPRFGYSLLITATLFLPHIFWQVSNNFPSFRYHLVGRNQGVKLFNLLKYFPEQFVVFNPVALAGLLYIMYKKKTENLFERGLYFLTGGILLFFQIMSLKGRVEPHWTMVASIPMILILYKASFQYDRFGKLFLKGTLWVLPFIVIARVLLMMDVLPLSFSLNGKTKRYQAIEKAAGSLPIAFTGSFQEPSLYPFFTGKKAFVLSSIPMRTTQFDIWGFDKLYQDSAVFIYTEDKTAEKYEIDGFEFRGFKIRHLQTTNQVKITYSDVPDQIYAGDTLRMQYTLFNPYFKDIKMDHPELPVEFCSVFNGPGFVITTSKCHYKPKFKILKAGEMIKGELEAVVPSLAPASDYFFGLALKTPIGIPYNSTQIKIQILAR